MRSHNEAFSVNDQLKIEKENVTIDFSSNGNSCPNTNSNPLITEVSLICKQTAEKM